MHAQENLSLFTRMHALQSSQRPSVIYCMLW